MQVPNDSFETINDNFKINMKLTFWKLEAAFDATLCNATLFAGGGSGAASYRCSQSFFLMDILFNPDPSVIPLDFQMF